MTWRGIRSLLAAGCLAAALLLGTARGPAAQISSLSGGDTTLAAGASIALYPCFSLGGGHIHSPQFFTAGNNCGPARLGGYVFTSVGNLRVRIFGPTGVDSSGFTVPGGSTFNSIPVCDSVLVLSTSTQSTRVTWGFFK